MFAIIQTTKLFSNVWRWQLYVVKSVRLAKNLKQFIPLNQIKIKINTEKEFFFNDLL